MSNNAMDISNPGIDEVFKALWDTHPSPGKVADLIRELRDLARYQRNEILGLKNRIARAKELASLLDSQKEYDSAVASHAELRLVPFKMLEELRDELR